MIIHQSSQHLFLIKCIRYDLQYKEDINGYPYKRGEIDASYSRLPFVGIDFKRQKTENESIHTWLNVHRDYIDILTNSYYFTKIFVFYDRRHNSSSTSDKN